MNAAIDKNTDAAREWISARFDRSGSIDSYAVEEHNISPARTRSSFLRLVVYIDPYSFFEDVASHFAGDDENHEQTEQDVVLPRSVRPQMKS